VVKIERFLSQHQGKTVHANHMSLLNLKYSLCGFYGRVGGYTMNEMTEEMLRRKKQLCEETLAVLNKIDAGPSPRKGIIMYEVHMPLILLAKMRLDREGSVVRDEVKKQFQRGILNLKMGLEMLKNQPEDTFEHNVFLGAKESLPQLEKFVTSQL